ncbi:putative bifunctional diguanylate cyclase/phosphodiesterase [Mangrovicella endophytica]|uniref:putative bifunctional diguanylate cyclase/phosphodiesterase n=1 Tax=Mangrovicella endophytica TaxID=2066697 RepID=UPI001FE04DB4|nr:EAL domain-containing protein [Mangrovicella endophytica]
MNTDDLTAGRIRLRQLQAVDDVVPATMTANIGCSAALVALLLDHGPGVLIGWFVLIAIMSGWRLTAALRVRQAVPMTASTRAIRRSIIQAGVMAVFFTSVPAWLLTQTSGVAYAIVVCFITGLLWAGGLVLSAISRAAAVYITLTVAITICGILVDGMTPYHLFLAFLFIVGGGTALRSAVRTSHTFVAAQLQQIAMERQSDVIGVLLKDYEEQASDWLWETDGELHYRNVSDRFVEALGRPHSEIEGIAFGALCVDESSADNAQMRRAIREQAEQRRTFRDLVIAFKIDGERCWWSFSGRPTYDEAGRFLGYRGVCSDVSTAKRAELRLEHLAHHDALTDLPNRMLFSRLLSQALEPQSASQLALLSLDLDGFKAVNDRHGHPIGDLLLVEVSQRLRSCLCAADHAARFGGDEFIVLHYGATSIAAIETLATCIIETLKAPFHIDGIEASIGVSIGIALGPQDGNTAEMLLKNVDAALYRAKADGRGLFRFFSAEMDGKLQDRRRIIQDLRLAIARNEFVLHYQPFVDSQSETVTGCEALLRWQHPERGLIQPGEFITLAEESGLIVEIGDWVLREACREAATWPSDLRVSVNVSALQFGRGRLPRTILSALAETGLLPSRLEIEVTEAVLIDDATAALDLLRQIRALGVRVALDDFGTGYSSLSYLRSFPFDKIKIDKSFVNDLAVRQDTQLIVRAIRDIAQGLGMSITAEGVETAEQADHLRGTGCQELQGYLYARPQPADELPFIAPGEPLALTA